MAGGCGSTPPHASPAPDADLTRIMADAVQARHLPGIAVVVLRGDETLFARGVAPKGTTPPDPFRTVFQLGSISKQFLSASVLRLADAGRLSLEDRVTRHLPDFPLLPPALTVRHLLSHTSGIRELFLLPGAGEAFGNPARTAAELHAAVRRAPVDFPPGERWSYSNTNYTILAMLVERLTGRPYEQVLREQFFAPLDLGSLRACTTVPRPEDAPAFERRKGGNVPAPPENMNWIRGDGGLCGTAVDVARWVRLLATGRVVSPEAYRSMTSQAATADGRRVDYGLGLSLVTPDGTAKVSHNGAMLGFSASAAYYPEHEATVVVLVNRGDVRTESIERALARRLLDLRAPDYDARDLTAAERSAYLGRYDIGPFALSVVDRNGQLWMEMPAPGPTVRLRYIGSGRFVGDADPDASQLTFVRTEQGGGVRLFMGGMHWYGLRVPD